MAGPLLHVVDHALPTAPLLGREEPVKRCGHGYRSFDNYRLRVLLHAGGIRWPERARCRHSELVLPS